MFSSPTMTRYIHYRNTFSKKKERKSFNFHLLSQKLAPFGRDFLFSTSCRSLRKPTKQCSHSHFFFSPSTDRRTTPLDQRATPFPLKTKPFPEGTSRKLHCFFEGSVQLHVAKVNAAPRDGSVLAAARQLQLWSGLSTAKRLPSSTSSLLGSMCYCA